MMRRFFAAFLALALIASQASAFVLNPYRLASAGETSLFAKLTALGLTTNLQIALDAGSQGSVGDAYPQAVRTLLHGNGTDASTTIFDSSPLTKTWTAAGNTQLDTAQFKFGSASILFDGTGDYLFGDGSSDFAFGTGDFTVEFWVRRTVTSTTEILYDSHAAGTGGNTTYPVIYIDGSDHLIVGASSVITGTTALSSGTWYHVALARASGSTKLFLNGTQEGSTYSDSTNYVNGSSRPLVGINGTDASGNPFAGWIDDLRVTKGVARYTSNFTAPTSEFPNPYRWFDLSGNAQHFKLGDASTTTTFPTFQGTPYALTSSEYWLFADEGQYFTYQSTNETWMQNMHKDNAAFTWAFWVYTGPLGAAGQTLFTTIDLDTTDTGAIGYISTTGNLAFVVVSSGISVYAAGTSAELSGVSTGAWHFMAFSVDEAGNAINWNQDGLEATESATYNTPSSGSATATLQIGGGYANLTGGDNSRLGEVAAWSRALTQAELRNVYAATKGRYQ